MKKLAVYAALLVTVLAVTACENRPVTNPPPRDRTIERTTPQNPNPPTNPDQTQQR